MARPGFFSITSLTSVHILLVDDEPESREELVAALGYCGTLLTVVDSDSEAIRALDLVRPDIVVIALPRRHRGDIALVNVVRSRKPEKNGVVPIVAIVSAGDTLPPDSGVTLTLSRPIEAWRICAELARLVSAR
jgi:CheY-like chemotaxis protein